MRIGVLCALVAGATLPATAPADAAPLIGSTIEPPIDCTPTGARPYPVVVLPGGDGTTAETASQWAVMTSALRDSGACVLVFQSGIVNGTRWAGDVPSSADAVAKFVAKVEATTGATKVDIVAHSAGSLVAHYFAKALHGAPNVHAMVLLAPEGRDCDGRGFAKVAGLPDLPISPVELLHTMPFVPPLVAQLMPDKASTMQLVPGSDVMKRITDGPIAQPGVRYSIMATKNDELATPAGTCSFVEEPGVTNVFYEDVFPGAPAVNHSLLRASPNTAKWVVDQL
jgi:pimeloyl-ACP methyl ester carboxylesterase